VYLVRVRVSDMEKRKPLTEEQIQAINDLMHSFRYEFEGDRSTDSIESWVDTWIERER